MLRKMKKAVALLAAAAMMTSIFATTVWAADVPETAVSAANGIFGTTAGKVASATKYDFNDKQQTLYIADSTNDTTYSYYDMNNNGVYLKSGIGGKENNDYSPYVEFVDVPESVDYTFTQTDGTASSNVNKLLIPVYKTKVSYNGAVDGTVKAATMKFSLYADSNISDVYLNWYYENQSAKGCGYTTDGIVISPSDGTAKNSRTGKSGSFESGKWNDIAMTIYADANNNLLIDYYVNENYNGTWTVTGNGTAYTFRFLHVGARMKKISEDTTALRTGIMAIDDYECYNGIYKTAEGLVVPKGSVNIYSTGSADFNNAISTAFENGSALNDTDMMYTNTYCKDGNTYRTMLKSGIGGKSDDDLSACMIYKNVPAQSGSNKIQFTPIALPINNVLKVGKGYDEKYLTLKFNLYVGGGDAKVELYDLHTVSNTFFVGGQLGCFTSTHPNYSGTEGVAMCTNSENMALPFVKDKWNEIVATVSESDSGNMIVTYYINGIYAGMTDKGYKFDDNVFSFRRCAIRPVFGSDIKDSTTPVIIAIDDVSTFYGKATGTANYSRPKTAVGGYTYTSTPYGFDDKSATLSLASPDATHDYLRLVKTNTNGVNALLRSGVGGRTDNDYSVYMEYDVPKNGTAVLDELTNVFAQKAIDDAMTYEYSLYISGDVSNVRMRLMSFDSTAAASSDNEIKKAHRIYRELFVFDNNGTMTAAGGNEQSVRSYAKGTWNRVAITAYPGGNAKLYFNGQYVCDTWLIPSGDAHTDCTFGRFDWNRISVKYETDETSDRHGVIAVDDINVYAGEYSNSSIANAALTTSIDVNETGKTYKAVAKYHGSQSVSLPYSDKTTIVLAFYKGDVLDHVKYTQAGKLFSNGSIEVEDTIADATGMTAKAFFIDDFDNMYPFAEAVDFN